MQFYLGTAWPCWLERTSLPLCVSAVTLVSRKSLPRALGSWILDSGAFSQIHQHGQFTIGPKEYARLAQRCASEIGLMQGAAIQDWMCEPFILAKTGKTIRDHQKLTVESYHELRYYAPDIAWIPVLQGFFFEDYLEHLALYDDYSDDLRDCETVGVGSICRRQTTKDTTALLLHLNRLGLKLHAFGLKELALRRIGHHLASSDSMAWSFRARREQSKLDACSHRVCTNCLPFASRWYSRIIASINHEPFPCQDRFIFT